MSCFSSQYTCIELIFSHAYMHVSGFIYIGHKVIFKVALAIITQLEEQLLKVSDITKLLPTLLRLPDCV